ncbi:tripartite tricarboxylate transporter substrate binding protein [Cytobacillus sp. FSL W7-1323]|uniref:tripartite tricarboxylate transporter substrate binding protein n=1 Tax=unclassified Cytobacillus TaxID=2675268 RepID=UPI002AFEF9D2|nr:tripartite tricarboxylate transporter substrate binding protein [Cytobacillus sp. OWB-43]MEA1852748.1 tripartite tricarboxylate transporter substrate binding protein [Cytobacillus sp. OWB-43]
MKKMKARSFVVVLLVTLVMLVLSACNSSDVASSSEKAKEENEGLPENYPNKSIDALVGFAPGGGQDLIMRTTAQILNDAEIIKQSFVVTNKTGAGGRIASEELARQNSDPYKLIVIPEYGPGWDPRLSLKFSDFQPIASLATSELFIYVHKDSPYETIEELLSSLKSEKDVTIGTLGPIDGGEAFKWDLIKQGAGIDKLNFVPMEGASEGLTAVLGGQIDTTLGVLPLINDYIKTGEVRVLAVLSEERSKDLPDVPTLKESGVEVAFHRYTGIWTGGDVSAEVVNYWAENLEEMTETDTWKTFLKNRGLSPYYLNTEEYTKLIEEEGIEFKKYLEDLEK